MNVSLSALQGHVEAAVKSGSLARALPVLDSAVEAEPGRTDVRLLRAMVLQSLQRHRAALDEFDVLLAMAPDNDAARFQRALVLFGQERLEAALEDFMVLTRKRPDTVEPWANAGVILLRMDRFAEAVPLLRQATRLSPGHPGLRRSLANSLVRADGVEEALRLYESVVSATPRDTAALTDYAMALLGIGRAREAHGHLLSALRIDPADQTALAGLYLSANELGLHDVVHLLADYERLAWYDVPRQEAQLDRMLLRDAVLTHPGLVWQPSGRSTHQGRQSPMLDLSTGSPFAPFGALVQHLVAERLAELAATPGLREHPWVANLPRRWRLQAWCTILESGGRQTPHIHPAGRLSGVYYLDTGNSVDMGGTLVFGQPPDNVPVAAPPRLHSVIPRAGYACCFPSYFFHHTEPFRGTHGPRISLAFDVIPLV